MAEPIVASKQLVEEIFDGAAERYDRTGPDIFRQFGARLVEWVDIPAGARVLDVATGTGAVLLPAAQRAGVSGQAIGVDLSNEMLGEANRAAHAAGLLNFELGCMDAEALQFPDGAFDVVTCGFGIFFFASMETALRESHRVTKPGGQIGLTVWGKAPFDPAWKMYAEQVRKYGVEVRMPQKVAYAPAEMEALLAGAGYANVETMSEISEVVFSTEEDWWGFQMTNGSRAAFYRLPAGKREEFKQEYLSQLRSLIRTDGLHLPAPVIYVKGRKP